MAHMLRARNGGMSPAPNAGRAAALCPRRGPPLPGGVDLVEQPEQPLGRRLDQERLVVGGSSPVTCASASRSAAINSVVDAAGGAGAAKAECQARFEISSIGGPPAMCRRSEKRRLNIS